MKAGTCRTITACGHQIRESVTGPAQLHVVLCTRVRIPARLMRTACCGNDVIIALRQATVPYLMMPVLAEI